MNCDICERDTEIEYNLDDLIVCEHCYEEATDV